MYTLFVAVILAIILVRCSDFLVIMIFRECEAAEVILLRHVDHAFAQRFGIKAKLGH